jgi:hypothetical protein
MPNDVEIVVTGRDAGATKVLDDVAASSRAAEKAQKETAKASQLAAQVIKEAGGVVSQQSLKLVKAKEAERKASEDLARVQAAARRGYLDEAQGAMAAAAAMNRLSEAKIRVATLSVEKVGTGGVLRERFSEHLGEFGITESMGGATAALVGVAAVAAEAANKMREAVASTLEYGEAIHRASEKTGLATETLSVLHYAAATTGGDFDAMTGAVAKMDKTIGQAAAGNKTAQGLLRSLGLDATELAGRSDGADIAWKKFTETIAATENPIARVHLATAMLGKAGAEQIPLILELAERWGEFSDKTESTGHMLTKETAAALAATNQKLNDMKQAIDGATVSFGEGFAPALDRMLDVMAGGMSHMEMFRTVGEDIARVLAAAAAAAYAFASGLARVDEIQSLGTLTAHGRAASEQAQDWSKKSQQMADIALGRGAPASPAAEAAAPAAKPHVITPDPGTADRANQKRLKAMEAALDEEKTQFNVSIKAEYEYWTARQNAFARGSDEYDSIVKKRASLAQEGARRDSQLIAKFKADELRRAREQAPEDKAGPAMARQNARAQESRFDTSNELYAIQQRTTMQLAEMAVQEQVGRTITEESGAMQIAAIHTAAYGAELERLMAKRKAIAENPLLSDGEADQQRKVDELNRRIAEVQAGRAIEIQRDAYGVKNADQSAVKGATDALQEFRLSAMNAAQQMHQMASELMNGVHQQILNMVMGDRTDFRSLGHDAAKGVADMGLKKLEANGMNAAQPLLEKLGLGGMFKPKRDGSSATAALYVQMIGAAAMPGLGGDLPGILGIGLPGMPENKTGESGGFSAAFSKMLGIGKDGTPTGSSSDPFYVKTAQDGSSAAGGLLKAMFSGGGDGSDDSGDSGGGGFFSSLLGALPGFADGVTDFAGGPAIVGERGPEIVNLPRGSSVTPNRMIGAGGPNYQHHGDINIHADGGVDREGMRSLVHQAVDTRMQMHMKTAGAGLADSRSRLPSARRAG